MQQSVDRRRTWRLRIVALLGPAVLLLAVAGAAGSAGATSAGSARVHSWAVVPSADVSPTSSDQLTSVSCPRPSFCAAVGTSSSSPLVEVEHRGTWTVSHFADTNPPTLSALDGVSCSSARFCMAVGDATMSGPYGMFIKVPAAETWNGSVWQLIPVPVNPGASGFESLDQLTAVSCLSSTFCAATVATTAVNFVGSEPVGTLKGYVETWNGSGWSPSVAGNQPVSVSCATPSFCVATGTEGGAGFGALTSGGNAFAEVFNGATWTRTDFPLPAGSDNGLSGATLSSVTCLTAMCLATGTQQLYVEAPPGTFTAGPVTSIDASYDGTTWSTTAVPVPPMPVAGVACAVAGTCVGVGECTSGACGGSGAPLIESLAAGTWTSVPLVSAPASGALAAVSCASHGRCTAVGGQQGPARTLAATGRP